MTQLSFEIIFWEESRLKLRGYQTNLTKLAPGIPMRGTKI